MPPIRRKTLTLSTRRGRSAKLLLALMPLWLTACAQMPSAEPPVIARKPRPAPLPAAILQIDTKPSTDTLSKGLQWSERSEAILSGETSK